MCIPQHDKLISIRSYFPRATPSCIQIFHYVRSRELRAVTLLGRAFKYQLDCQEIWRQLYFLRFSTAFGKFKSWKILYIQVCASVVGVGDRGCGSDSCSYMLKRSHPYPYSGTSAATGSRAGGPSSSGAASSNSSIRSRFGVRLVGRPFECASCRRLNPLLVLHTPTGAGGGMIRASRASPPAPRQGARGPASSIELAPLLLSDL